MGLSPFCWDSFYSVTSYSTRTPSSYCLYQWGSFLQVVFPPRVYYFYFCIFAPVILLGILLFFTLSLFKLQFFFQSLIEYQTSFKRTSKIKFPPLLKTYPMELENLRHARWPWTVFRLVQPHNHCRNSFISLFINHHLSWMFLVMGISFLFISVRFSVGHLWYLESFSF